MPAYVSALLDRLCHDPAAVQPLFAEPLPASPAGGAHRVLALPLLAARGARRRGGRASRSATTRPLACRRASADAASGRTVAGTACRAPTRPLASRDSTRQAASSTSTPSYATVTAGATSAEQLRAQALRRDVEHLGDVAERVRPLAVVGRHPAVGLHVEALLPAAGGEAILLQVDHRLPDHRQDQRALGRNVPRLVPDLVKLDRAEPARRRSALPG